MGWGQKELMVVVGNVPSYPGANSVIHTCPCSLNGLWSVGGCAQGRALQGLDHKFFSRKLCSLAKAGIGRPEFWSPGSTLVPKDLGQEVSSLPGAPSVVRAKSSLHMGG